MPSFGTIKADTLTHSTAGSLATNFVVNGSSVCWVDFQGAASTISPLASLNVSSLDDDGTGSYGVNVTSAMSSADYVCLTGGNAYHNVTANSQTTTAWDIEQYNSSHSAADANVSNGAIHGDLA
tara:strand:- start:32 stop:403 length:372 start_codon:yes stop_codon:yes gene_type:complete